MRVENFTILTEKVSGVKDELREWVGFYRPDSPAGRELCESAVMARAQKRRLRAYYTATVNDQIRTAKLRHDQAEEDKLKETQDLFRTNPALACILIKRCALGCRWLIGRYARLALVLARDGTLLGNDRDELIRYMGCEPYLDKLYESEDAYLVFLYCAVCKPVTNLAEFDELRAEGVMPESLRDRDINHWMPPRPHCRELLRQRIDEEIARLRRMEATLRVAFEEPARESAEVRASMLTGPDGSLWARYYKMHELEFDRCYRALEKTRQGADETAPIDAAPSEPFQAPAGDASASQEADLQAQTEADLARDLAAETEAAQRHEAAASLAPSEANGIGAPMGRGDQFITAVLGSQWWSQRPCDAPADPFDQEPHNGRPPHLRLRE